mmetsp:Transcript_78305/g.205504  ORF Transcript_78305/g.205504 Transcript_78305/m.205504 type:complete len:202 (-) Transcript_78305:122-727(-)
MEARVVLHLGIVRGLVLPQIQHVGHHLPQEDAKDLGLPLAAAPDGLRQHDGPAVVEVQQLEARRLESDEEADKVAAEERVRIGCQYSRTDHLRHQRARCFGRRLEEPELLLLLQAGEDLLVVQRLGQLLLLDLRLELLQAGNLLLERLVVPVVGVVAVALQVPPGDVKGLHAGGDRGDGLLVTLSGHEDVLQPHPPERDVE